MCVRAGGGVPNDSQHSQKQRLGGKGGGGERGSPASTSGHSAGHLCRSDSAGGGVRGRGGAHMCVFLGGGREGSHCQHLQKKRSVGRGREE